MSLTIRPVLVTMLLMLLSTAAWADKININTASEEELQELDGIGPKLAAEIVRDRTENGGFTTVEDLARVRGVSSRLVEKLLDKLSTGGSSGGGGSIVLKQGEKVPQQVVEQMMRAFGDEPTIREVQQAAIDYARADPGIVDSMHIRARTAAALPEMRIRPWTYIDRDVRTRTNLDASEAVVETKDDDNSFRFEVRATWDLDELIFSPAEPRIWRESARLTNLRDRVVNEATRRYYERRRLQIDLKLSPPTDLSDRVRKELRVQELTADLDALTGGWFSAELSAAGKEPY